MTAGLKAYELKMGEQARRSDLVNIFDYDDNNLTNNPSKQNVFWRVDYIFEVKTTHHNKVQYPVLLFNNM